MQQIDVNEARRLIEEGAVLIDCREQYEWDELRIPGAILVPLSEYESNPQAVERAETVIFHCAAGMRSQSAAAIYEAAHPGATAHSMDGGIMQWATTGHPTQ